MRIKTELTAMTLLLVVLQVSATVRYVDVNSTSATPPYTNWVTAATNIQDAVDAAGAGDEILVTNGVYQTGGRAVYGLMTNRVAVDKPLTVQSVNGPEVTVIEGVIGDTNSAVRCVYVGANAILSGFTLRNGCAASGGGLYCENGNPIISNCLITANSTFAGTDASYAPPSPAGDGGDGGGLYASLSSTPTVIDCLVSNNATGAGGSDIYFVSSAGNGGNGGGIYCGSATILRCISVGNRTGAGGATAAFPSGRGGDGGGIYCGSAQIIQSTNVGNATGAGGDNWDGDGGRGGDGGGDLLRRCDNCSGHVDTKQPYGVRGREYE